jgi:hypothetical protein
MKNPRGFAPIFILLIVALLGAGTYAVVNRDVLKGYFETGDIPTQEDFSDTIDSALNLNDDGLSADQKQYNPTKEYVAGDTVVKSEAIYQAKVLSETQKEFKLDAVQSVTFRWTPIVPKPQEPVTYRLKVWQLMQGQNGTSAMKTNQPIVTKDVDNLTEATVSGIYTGPCKPPYLCEFIWSVEVVKKADTDAGSSSSAGAEGAVSGSR